ncbi:MAG: Gx transporter family protein [Termitinemataceae bacterium]|nr:MAG: Gx transporter family protein [Termitinemataceae bacterium]
MPLYGRANKLTTKSITELQTTNVNRYICVLGALCFFLSGIEYLIPKPLPFMRIGLANLPILFALNFNFPAFLYLVMLKIVGAALINGTLFSYIFLFSLAGTITSSLTMYVMCHKIPQHLITFVGYSIAGAFVSNVAQLILSYYFILGKSTIYFAVPFLVCAVITGALLGGFANMFCKKSAWYQGLGGGKAPLATNAGSVSIASSSVLRYPPCTTRSAYQRSSLQSIPATDLFVCGIIFTVCLLLAKTTTAKLALFVLFWLYAIICKKSGSPVFTVLFFATIALVNLYPPYGKVIFSISNFRITSGALNSALQKTATIQALLFISRTTIRSTLKLPGNFGTLLKNSFMMLEIINDHKKNIRRKTFIQDIDKMLLEICGENKSTVDTPDINEEQTSIKTERRTLKTILILFVAIALPIYIAFYFV